MTWWAGANFELCAIPQVMQSTLLLIAEDRCVVFASQCQQDEEISCIKKSWTRHFQSLFYKFKNSCGPENISRVLKLEGLLVANYTFLQALAYFQVSPKCSSTYYRRRGWRWPLHFVIPACCHAGRSVKCHYMTCDYSIWVVVCA